MTGSVTGTGSGIIQPPSDAGAGTSPVEHRRMGQGSAGSGVTAMWIRTGVVHGLGLVRPGLVAILLWILVAELAIGMVSASAPIQTKRAIRPAPCPPMADGWQRGANPILEATETWEGGASGWLQEPSVLYESGTWKMWYTGGVSGSGTDYAMGYATCNGGGTWRKYPGNPVLGKGGSGYAGTAVRNDVVKVGDTYHAYFGNGVDLLHSMSPDGIVWARPETIITAASVPGRPTQLTNSFVWTEGPSEWRMLLELVGGTWGDAMSYWASFDGVHWTIGNDGRALGTLMPPGLYSAGGPWVIRDGSTYELWYVSTKDPSGLPTDIYRTTSTDGIDWGTPRIELVHGGSGTFEYDQVTDPALVTVGSRRFLFYTGANNTTDEGGPSFAVGLAVEGG